MGGVKERRNIQSLPLTSKLINKYKRTRKKQIHTWKTPTSQAKPKHIREEYWRPTKVEHSHKHGEENKVPPHIQTSRTPPPTERPERTQSSRKDGDTCTPNRRKRGKRRKSKKRRKWR